MIIKLTKGFEAIIDDIDADLVDLNWCVKPHHRNFYAHRGEKRDGRWTTVTMHNKILARIIGRPLKKGEMTDHIDGNGLNNIRSNLRLATNSLNKINGNKYATKPTTSQFKGVHWHKQHKKWMVRISKDNKRIQIGVFDNEINAARAYNDYARMLYGDRAKLNEV